MSAIKWNELLARFHRATDRLRQLGHHAAFNRACQGWYAWARRNGLPYSVAG